jgi:hypothetical protein
MSEHQNNQVASLNLIDKSSSIDVGNVTFEQKRFCCGAIKRLKEKCLRFNDQN